MTISNVTIHNVFTEGKLKAIASVVIDNFIEVHDIKVVQGTDRQFEALLSSRNALYEIFEQWCKNGELHGLEDIGIAIEEAADRILVSFGQ